jgi:hypothetical protein
MKVAFYKGTRSGIAAIYSIGVRLWTQSKYSHCELIFSDGMAASSSFSDGGVRFKMIDFDSEKWDIFEMPDHLEENARQWFIDHEGLKYDLLGNVRFIIGLVRNSNNRWFCSEAMGAALGLMDSWRFSPGDLFSIMKLLVANDSKLNDK